MRYESFAQHEGDFARFAYRPRPRKRVPPALLYGMVILASAGVGHWLASNRSPAGPTDQASVARLEPVRAAPQTAAALVSAAPAAAAPPPAKSDAVTSATPRDAASRFRPVTISYERYASLRDPALGSGRTPATLDQSAVLVSSFQPFPRNAPPVTPAPRIAALEAAPADPAPAIPAALPARPVLSDLGQDVPVPLPRPTTLASESLTLPPPTRAASAEPDDSRPRVVPPLPPSTELVEDVPVPTPRPASLTPPTREAQPRLLVRGTRAGRQTARAGITTVPSDNRTFFEKLFNVRPRTQPMGTALAYAAPDAGGLGLGLGSGLSRATSSYDRYTAIYDISAHTVHLPDGSKLEAHSGLGGNIDDPRSVRVRMRGATPPNVYELAPRTELFHGVRAIRLNPTDNRSMYGRDGILAHTYMLGPRGDSNGCVVFKDYRAFLAAFDSGMIRRMAVVSSLN